MSILLNNFREYDKMFTCIEVAIIIIYNMDKLSCLPLLTERNKNSPHNILNND